MKLEVTLVTAVLTGMAVVNLSAQPGVGDGKSRRAVLRSPAAPASEGAKKGPRVKREDLSRAICEIQSEPEAPATTLPPDPSRDQGSSLEQRSHHSVRR